MSTPKKTPATPPTGWWSTSPVRWSDVADGTFARWHKNQRGKTRLDDDAAQRAMIFGFGARDQYGEHRPWNDLEAQLQADWVEAGREGEQSWEDVVKAVKSGWTAAATPIEPAHEKAVATEPAAEPSPHEPHERNVPGGRPDRHA